MKIKLHEDLSYERDCIICKFNINYNSKCEVIVAQLEIAVVETAFHFFVLAL